MVCIAILGYGVVGSGVLKLLPQDVKRVLDRVDYSGELGGKYTRDFSDILKDDDIQVIVEAMGGVSPAYDYVKSALLAGKHVCTSNKELVAAHGAELLALAAKMRRSFLFEASVGGGIPLVRPFNHSLVRDEIFAVTGILNGTSNFMLTQMQSFGKSYAEALEEAQRLGYAESDPTADVGGFDAARKLAILLSLATGQRVDFEDIHTEGISDITGADLVHAREHGFVIKPMVDARITKDGVTAISAPMLVHHSSPLYSVSGVYNSLLVQTKNTGDVMFYGEGAGQMPTASAVVSDVMDIAQHPNSHIPFYWSAEKILTVTSCSNYRTLARISSSNSLRIYSEFNEKQSWQSGT